MTLRAAAAAAAAAQLAAEKRGDCPEHRFWFGDRQGVTSNRLSPQSLVSWSLSLFLSLFVLFSPQSFYFSSFCILTSCVVFVPRSNSPPLPSPHP
ncbi:uncharacterized protein BO72DRAFT_189828 [Aspergillus fijiensis CBS 313.89]|uniref:Uncharacterized protein n=1 Tax=Aspergillus fijiensis CBS 313.89 TaxID=1448319 RepID=A0A8G1RK92_9EURO|nr:uncharacterized protein BO72DRAFT_189828 [Aspergillus fijiensis CBS 313.89]RAK74825.1 hypothetical protein BO72DRAFT_189828 [Aspergillus fijiensis CBS 313.89]